MTVLALETSCDETAVAILRGCNHGSSPELLASEVASQVAAHEKYGGIVPEIASRNHLIYAPQLLERATRNAKIDMSLIDAFAATGGPGLASDAAGEAFDKVAKLLGLGYPGGPEIEKRARDGDLRRFDLPRSMLDSENFSFSGLKTAVRYLLPKLNGDFLADVCASFQQAIMDVLVRKSIAAAQKYGVNLVTVSGGVSCNQELRRQLREACAREGFEFRNAEPWLCTDNAAMIAFAALLRLQAGSQSKVTDEIDPNLRVA